jgi:hypothetical protein
MRQALALALAVTFAVLCAGASFAYLEHVRTTAAIEGR